LEIVLRRARKSDRKKSLEVESKSTPNLRYLEYVFDTFVSDKIGEFSVAELDDEIVACGKYTIMPDGSAWLETLRVIPEHQGIGIGKRFYERFFDIAKSQGVRTMRMYTGIKNVVSKGLAERFGFQQVATYRGAALSFESKSNNLSTNDFQQVTDSEKSKDLILPYNEKWTGFSVMNRTFYAITPSLCNYLTVKGQVYEETSSNSVITLGARFMPDHALHIGVFGGEMDKCLKFATNKGLEQGVKHLSCLFPPSAIDVHKALIKNDFQIGKSDFIVMEVNLPYLD
jgi:N-acetylglutamate synthase-like GNAT family acetyltransferase